MTQSDYRVDQIISTQQRFFARYSTRLNNDKATIFFPQNQASPKAASIRRTTFMARWPTTLNTVSPATIFNARLGSRDFLRL